MLFWTIFLLATYVIMLFKGNFMTDTLIKVGELEIKKAEENKKLEANDYEPKYFFGITFLILLFITEIIYLVSAIKYDIYKYPTICLIIYAILLLALSKKPKKKDLSTEEGRNEYRKYLYQKLRRYTLKSSLIRMVYIIYFGYMFYLLVF